MLCTKLAKCCDDVPCKEILRLYETHKSLEKSSGVAGLTESQKLAYRRSVEALTGGTDTNLYRIEWVSENLLNSFIEILHSVVSDLWFCSFFI